MDEVAKKLQEWDSASSATDLSRLTKELQGLRRPLAELETAARSAMKELQKARNEYKAFQAKASKRAAEKPIAPDAKKRHLGGLHACLFFPSLS